MSIDLFSEFQKINEAFCVKHAIPTERRHTDDELVPLLGALTLAEAQLAAQELKS